MCRPSSQVADRILNISLGIARTIYKQRKGYPVDAAMQAELNIRQMIHPSKIEENNAWAQVRLNKSKNRQPC
jgi:hypothetical protein